MRRFVTRQHFGAKSTGRITTCALQATSGRPPPIILCGDRVGHQLCVGPGARPSAKAHLFRKQGLARPRVEVPVAGEGGVSSSVLSQKAPPLFPQFHSGGDDEPPHPESTSKARCSREDGSLGGRAVGV